MPQIEDWQNRPLSSVYSIIFIDAIHFSVRNDGIVSKLAAYVVLGINEDGMKEVLSIEVISMLAQQHNSKYIVTPLSHTQLADYLSVNRSAMTRELSKMRDEGIIDFDKDTFAIK